MPIFYFVLFIFFIVSGVSIFFYRRAKRRSGIFASLNTTLFLVMMPKYDIEDDSLIQKQERELIAHMEQIYTNFLYLKKPNFLRRITSPPPRVALEIASQTGGNDISFYVSVPRYLESAFEKYIQGVYPRAVVEMVLKDYTIFESKNASAGAYLMLESSDVYPINTYVNLEKDPISTMTNVLSKIEHDEGAAVQIVISPFPQQKWRRAGYKILEKIREGKSVEGAASEAFRSPVAEALHELVASFSHKTPQKRDEFGALEEEKQKWFEQKEPIVDERTIQAIQDKFQKQAFQTNIRLVTSAKTKERAEEILEHLMGGFDQFSLYSLNNFKAKYAKRKGQLKKFTRDFSFRNFVPSKKSILNIEELTSIYHFPTRYIETPYIKSAKSGAPAPPPELPIKEKGLNLIGQVNFRGEEKSISFATRQDRRRHFYVIGQTGTGKTSLLQEMIRQDIQNGEGVAVIDPHGDLIEDTLANIPKDRIEDVVLFEPSDTEHPIGLNMLEYDTPGQKDFAVQEMIAIFHKLFPPEIIGPMFEHYMRNAMLALMADMNNPGTLVEIPRMFTEPEFVDGKMEKVTDPVVKNFWTKEWKQVTGSTKSDMLGYIVSKVGRFIENEMMRNIIGQSRSAFDLGKIMDERKIFLANLSKGETGEVNSSLLGLILVSKMQMAAMKRGKIAEEERKDFYLYIDEFQNFTTDSIATILSEARKYRLNLIIAHQYIPQLQEDIRNAVLGNVGSIGAFRVGADDAEFLEKQFEPEFSRFDLVNLDNFNLAMKLMIDNKVYPSFKMETIIPKVGNPEIVASLKKISKLKYGRPKNLVESEIMERSSF